MHRSASRSRRSRCLVLAILTFPCVTFSCATFSCAAAVPASSEFAVLPPAFEMSPDPEKQQVNFYDFIWRSFIALNWPNVPIEIEGDKIVAGERGKPDASRPLSDLSGTGTLPLTVWETYKEPFEIFPPNGARPAAWNTPRPVPPDLQEQLDAAGDGERALLAFPIDLTGYATDANQPYFFPHATGPLYDQHGGLVRYEVAVNRSFLAYVTHFRYYDASEQIRAVQRYMAGRRDEAAFQRPPFGNPAEIAGYLRDLPAFAQVGLVDLKAAWRPLDPKRDRIERYLHRELVVGVEKGKPKTLLMGLVALHILRWTPNGFDPARGVDGAFVASTFEQIDNVVSNVAKDGSKVSPSFNDGTLPTHQQNDYGFEGATPALVEPGKPMPPPDPVDVYRAAAQRLPQAVQAINAFFQNSAPVKDSVLRYYQLIGTQNRHQGAFVFETAEQRRQNGHQGPITGVYTNENNLVNSVLESYTQKNFSCILCHIRARPFGLDHAPDTTPGFPPAAFEDDHFKILTFLLQSASMPTVPAADDDADGDR